MPIISLIQHEKYELEALRDEVNNPRLRIRIRALLAVSDGYPVSEIAAMLDVNRGTIYNWIQKFLADPSKPVVDRFSDRPRSGRPPKILTDEEEEKQYKRIMEKTIRYMIKQYDMKTTYSVNNDWIEVRFVDSSGNTHFKCDLRADDFEQYLADPSSNNNSSPKKPPREDRGEE